MIARRKAEDPIATARRHFAKLGMDKTAGRNGVLILVAPASRKVAVIGDAAAHEKAGDAFWQSVIDTLTESFRRGEFTEGIVKAVESVGEFLTKHFPVQPGDKNELSDEIGEV